jgi:hypothetical protein
MTSSLALSILAASLALGLLADALLRATPWGLNAPLCAAAVLLAVFAIARQQRRPLVGGGRWLALPALCFAAAFAWRDSPALLAFDVVALAACATLFAARARQGRVVVASLVEYALAALMVALHASIGAVALAVDVNWRALPGGRATRLALSVLGGLALATPLLLVFGALFASADVVFGRLVSDLGRWLAESLSDHLIVVAFFTWLVGGYLRQALVAGDASPLSLERPPALGLGIVPLGVVLGLLDALFLLFVAVQLRYLFGGADLVAFDPSLTYAEYARRGFFELVAVAALVVPVLLAAEWLLRAERPGQLRLFRALAGLLVGLVFLVVASAVQRMRIYQDVYGLTELRVYTTAVMAWIALVLAWLTLTVLRGRRDRFAFGALAAGLATVGLLDLINPDAFIARTNIARAAQGAALDAEYVGGLSADAAPALVEALPTLPADDRRRLARRLLVAWGAPDESDWRSWSWSRDRARAAVAASRPDLEAAAGGAR